MSHRLQQSLRNKQQGFILLELLALVAGILFASSCIFLQSDKLWRHYHKEQVRVSALLLASDLRQLQQQSLFRVNAITKDLRTNQAQNGYYLTEKGVATSAIRFADYACDEVYFASYIARVGFSQNGAPSSNGFYRLRHKQLTGFGYQVDVQPITGRVLVYEIQ